MKKVLSQVMSVVLVIALITAILHGVDRFFEYKQSRAKCDAFFDASEDFDILFFGTSHAVMGYLPMELWDEYHVTSYSFSNYGQWLPVDYWLLRLALEYHKPKLVVIDTYYYDFDEKYSKDHLPYAHEELDGFPYSSLKKAAVDDLFPSDKRWDFLFPFSVYHSQWNSISENNFRSARDIYTYGQGSDESALNVDDTALLVKPQKDIDPVYNTEVQDVESVGKEYLEKSIELCQEKGIDVLLTTIPFVADENYTRINNGIYEIAEKYGVNFYNGLRENIIDVKTDLWDAGHLNSSGGRKWTNKLGEFIKNNYDIPPHTEGDLFDQWNSDYNGEYMNFKIKKMSQNYSMENYLMLGADKHLSACVYISNVESYKNSEELNALLENMVGQKQLERLKTTVNDGGDYVLIVDKGHDEIEELDAHTAYSHDFSFGEVKYDEKYLSINQSDNYILEHFEDGSAPFMQIVLINELTNQVADVSRFSLVDEEQSGQRHV